MKHFPLLTAGNNTIFSACVLNLGVHISVSVCAHWMEQRMKEKDIILYCFYRQKVMSLLKQAANNRRQKYNNTRQSARLEGEFQ